MEAVVNSLNNILASNKNRNLCLGRLRLILTKKILDIHSTIRQRTSLEKAPLDSGSTLCFAGIAKEDESKAANLFTSFERMSISVRRKQEEQKAKKTGSIAEANDPVS